MFDPRDISSDPRTLTPQRPKRDYLKERQDRTRTGSRAEFDPRSGGERCCMDRGGDGIRPFPSGSVRRYFRTQAVRVRSLCSGLSGRPGSP